MKPVKVFIVLVLLVYLSTASAASEDKSKVLTNGDLAKLRILEVQGKEKFIESQESKSTQEKQLYKHQIKDLNDEIEAYANLDSSTIVCGKTKEGKIKLVDIDKKEHKLRSIKLRYEDIRKIPGFQNNLVKITHYNDAGLVDAIWTQEVRNDNGWVYLDDLPFSEIEIGGFIGEYQKISTTATTDVINLGTTFSGDDINYISLDIISFNTLNTVVGFEWNASSSSPVLRQIDYSGNTLPKDYDFNSNPIFGGIKRCVVDPTTGNVTYGTNARGDGLDLSGASGQVMVEYPRFYYKYEYDNSTGHGLYRYWVSPYNISGFDVYPSFVQRGGYEVEYIYQGAFEASGSLKNEQFVLDSATGKIPCTGGVAYPDLPNSGRLTIDDAETYAKLNGAGWGISNVWSWSMIQTLMYIEYGNLNVQTALGKGVVDLPSGTDFAGKLTGADSIDDNIGADGTGTGTGTNGQTPVCWRGIENIWGNTWKFVNGINMYTDGSVRILRPDGTGTPAGTLTEGNYITLPGTVPLVDGYINGIQSNELGAMTFIPSAATGSSSTYLCDYFYYPRSNPSIVRFGGGWDGGLIAGPGCRSASYGPALSYRYCGARLEFIPQSSSDAPTVNYGNPKITFSTNGGSSATWAGSEVSIPYSSGDISEISIDSDITGQISSIAKIGYTEDTTVVEESLTDDTYEIYIRYIPGNDYETGTISYTAEAPMLTSSLLKYDLETNDPVASLSFDSGTFFVSSSDLKKDQTYNYRIICSKDGTQISRIIANGFGNNQLGVYSADGTAMTIVGSRYLATSAEYGWSLSKEWSSIAGLAALIPLVFVCSIVLGAVLLFKGNE